MTLSGFTANANLLRLGFTRFGDRCLTCCLFAVTLTGPVPVSAVDDKAVVEEVMVTAVKRLTPLQKTPAAITAIDGAELTLDGSAAMVDVQRMSPGLIVIETGLASRRFAVRGVQSAGEATAGVYFDETPVTGAVGAGNDSGGAMPALELVDIERIEVLRGPQGTLYGAGAMSGAVRVLMNKPEASASAAVGLVVNNIDDGEVGTRAELVTNLPVVDTLAARAVLYNIERGGYIDNRQLGEKDINDMGTDGARLGVRYEPSERFRVDATAVYQKAQGQTPTWYLEQGAYHSVDHIQLPNSERLTLVSLTSQWQAKASSLDTSVSHFERDLTSITFDPNRFFATFYDSQSACARLQGGGQPCSDTDMAAYNDYVDSIIPAAVRPAQTTRQDTAELRWQSIEQAPTRWTLGVFYSDRDNHVDNSQFAVDSADGALIQPQQIQFQRLIFESLRQHAAFAEVTSDFGTDWEITLGTRYFEYHRRSAGETTLGLALINAEVTPFARYESRETGWLWKVVLAHDIGSSSMLYLGATEGFRPGGVNQVIGLPEVLVAYEADTLWNYEAGLKSQLSGGRIQTNLSLYRIDWDNMQVSGSRPDGLFRFIANAGEARLQGIEAEFSVAATERLQLLVNTNWLDARLTEDQRNDSVIAPGRAGDRIPYIPKFTAGVHLTYQLPVFTQENLSLRLASYYREQSATELRPDNPFYRELPGYAVTDVSLRWQLSESTQVSLFVENLGNEVALVNGAAAVTSVGQTLVTSLPPRTLGISFSKHF